MYYLLLPLVLLLVIPVLSIIFHALTSPLRNVPGPLLARFTRVWELLAQLTGRFESTNIALHERYGPIVRLAPNRYSLASPAAAKQLYGHGNKFLKTTFYHPFNSINSTNGPNIFTATDPAQHSAVRRRVSTLYAMSSLVGYEGSIDGRTQMLMRRFREFAQTGTHVNMREWLQFYAYDVIGEITTGRSFGIMDAGRDSGILHAIDHYLTYASRVGLLPEWHFNFAKINSVLPMLSYWLQPFEQLTVEVTKHIDARFKADAEQETGSSTNDFMSKLVAMRKEGRVDDNDLRSVVGGNISAGSDTTAISLSSVMLELARNPDCTRKLRDEINQMASECKLSNPVTFKESQQMPYLQAIIKEALRVHPAVGQILPRYVPAEGVELDGQFFPGGTVVGINAWVLHRDKEVFGSDADKFRPERWLESKERAAKMDQCSLAFGGGSRTCIGKNISLLEMNKVIPQLVRTFDFELIHLAPNRNDWFVKQNFECQIRTLEGQEAGESY